MCASLTSNPSCVCWPAPDRPRLAKSSRCMAEEITPASPARPRSWCRRSASQAPPDVMPTSRVSGTRSCCTPRSNSRYSASASRNSAPAPAVSRPLAAVGARAWRRPFARCAHGKLLKNCSRMTQAAPASGSLRPVGERFGGAVALVHFEHRQLQALAQLAREFPRPHGIVVAGAVRMERHAHHQGVGLPLRARALRPRPVAPRPCARIVACGVAVRSRRLPTATPVRLRPKSKARNV